jgi:carbamoyl-phosphate synthase large subunit
VQEAKEVEVDGVSDGESVFIGAIIEHIENAGVHSGDATMCIPPHTLPPGVIKTIQDYTNSIGKSLQIRGPFNIQYLVKDNVPSVIECNLRASRSVPFVSKTMGVNLIELATRAMLGKKLPKLMINQSRIIHHVGVKVPQFSFMRLSGADPVLGVEMLSTGEVACLGKNLSDALLKALEAADFKTPPLGGSVLITVAGEDLKRKIMPLGRSLEKLGFKIYATEHTAEAMQTAGVSNVTVLHKIRNPDEKPNILEFILQRKIDLVINIPVANSLNTVSREALGDEYVIRRLAVEFNIPVVTRLELASALVEALEQSANESLTINSLNEYIASTQN